MESECSYSGDSSQEFEELDDEDLEDDVWLRPASGSNLSLYKAESDAVTGGSHRRPSDDYTSRRRRSSSVKSISEAIPKSRASWSQNSEEESVNKRRKRVSFLPHLVEPAPECAARPPCLEWRNRSRKQFTVPIIKNGERIMTEYVPPARKGGPPPLPRPASAYTPRPGNVRVQSARRQRTYSARLASTRPGVPVVARTYSAMKQAGPSAEDDFEDPVSIREGWWRKDLKDTPNPGAYESKDFMHDVSQKYASYGFQSMQRVCKLGMDGVSGEGLMPGMYTSKSFTESLDKKGASYGFRTMERDKIPKIGPGQDKHLAHLCPTRYQSTSNVPDVSHGGSSVFTSKIGREVFKPKSGPGPAQFNMRNKVVVRTSLTGTSAFESKVPRLATRRTSALGPGSYTPMDPNPLLPSFLGHNRRHKRTKSAPPLSYSRFAVPSTSDSSDDSDTETDPMT